MTTLFFRSWAHQSQLVKKALVLKFYKAVIITSLSPLCMATVETQFNHTIKMSSATNSESNNDGSSSSCLPKDASIHAAHINEVHNVPMSVLTRPIPSVLDESKVLSLMETIQVSKVCMQYTCAYVCIVCVCVCVFVCACV